jgi:hypothetical protein
MNRVKKIDDWLKEKDTEALFEVIKTDANNKAIFVKRLSDGRRFTLSQSVVVSNGKHVDYVAWKIISFLSDKRNVFLEDTFWNNRSVFSIEWLISLTIENTKGIIGINKNKSDESYERTSL